MPRTKKRVAIVRQPMRQQDGVKVTLDDIPGGGGGTLPSLHGNERHTVAFQSAADVAAAIAANWPLAPNKGGTGTATVFTPGSLVFVGASGIYAENNAKLLWDDTNNRLGIGTATPQDLVHVLRSDGDAAISFENTQVGGIRYRFLTDAGAEFKIRNQTDGRNALTIKRAAQAAALVISDNIQIGTTIEPSAGRFGMIFADSTPLSGLPSNTAGFYADAVGGTVKMHGIHQDGITGVIGLVQTKTTTGDPTGSEGLFVINTFDNTFKVYADGAWRTLASGW